ncbi:DUF5000 domain-containing lipoprotein [Snuella sedimenti]|uniref:DUF4959 domain-containing protein n=1 Tax=Snuella sedimenti TaxID=2798802 RepID=A0A8J7J232_9FLAO|nr:DUF5000 domain-containing lipoprotein [Snuella sedimenti]MBJ6366668.1 DUF4959 domain-containing protein [Snuella sedimenti]
MKKILSLLLVCTFILLACQEDYEHNPITSDDVIPSAIENLSYTSINGGFDISYDLPSDKDLLYVKAVYENSKGEMAEVRASIYDNKIQILGFGDTSEKEVTVYAVDRSENVSKGVSFTASPLMPPVHIIKGAMEITPDFGGAKFKWVNEQQTPIAILLFAENEQGELENVHTVYTSQSETSHSLRGFESVPQPFAAVIRDRYDNFSDTIYPGTPDKLLTPLFEERLDKAKFQKVVLANDDNWDAWEGDYWNAFDDDLGSIVHTQGDHPRPSIMTIDLGANVVLSRIKLFQRAPNQQHWAYTHGNPKSYTLYGAKELPGSDGNLDNWIKLRGCESIKPSGLPIGQNTDEDIAHFLAGDEYTFEESVEIRYFRLAVQETWDGAGFINFSELTFWGNVIN